MPERITFAEAQDAIETISVPDPMMFVAELLAGREKTEYVEALRGLTAAAMTLRMFLERDECDCDNRRCPHKEPHRKIANNCMRETLERIENDIQQLKHDAALFLYKAANCDCGECKLAGQTDAAPFN